MRGGRVAEDGARAGVQDRSPQIPLAGRGAMAERIDTRKNRQKLPTFDRRLDCAAPHSERTQLRIAHPARLALRVLANPFYAAGYSHPMYRAAEKLDSPPIVPAKPPPKIIGVAGAGTMGAGIAQLAALAGARTLLHDPIPEALEQGIQQINGHLERGAVRGRWSEEDA